MARVSGNVSGVWVTLFLILCVAVSAYSLRAPEQEDEPAPNQKPGPHFSLSALGRPQSPKSSQVSSDRLGGLMNSDLAVLEIPSPPALTPPLEAVSPACIIENTGLNPAYDFQAYLRMTPGTYCESTSVESLSPGSSLRLEFPYWVAGRVGQTYSACAWVSWSGDTRPSNDTLCKRVIAWDDRWYIHSAWCDNGQSFVSDGYIDTVVEWKGSTKRDVSDFLGRASPFPRQPGSGFLYVMNDSANVYLGLDGVSDMVYDALDIWTVCFEDNFDRMWPEWPDSSEGETSLGFGSVLPVLEFLPRFADSIALPFPVALRGGAGVLSGHVQCEMAIPLGDTVYQSDTTGRHASLLAEPGDTVGFWTTGGNGTDGRAFIWWPTSSVRGFGNLSDMGMIILKGDSTNSDDLAVLSIVSPPDTVVIDSSYPVGTIVGNSGGRSYDFWLECTIGDSGAWVYQDSAAVRGLGPGSEVTVYLPEWHVTGDPTNLEVCCFVNVRDSDTTNNRVCKDIHQIRVGICEPPFESRYEGFRLRQNVPNPFSGRTLVRWTLGRPCHVRLDVLDAAGRVVRDLTEGDLDAGSYELEWDGRGEDNGHLSGGIYFVRISAGTLRRVVKSVKLR